MQDGGPCPAWTTNLAIANDVYPTLEGFHRKGVGQALLDTAIGDRPAYHWALADNPRAHAFSRRNGFELDGVSKVDEFWQVLEVRFIR